MGLVKWFALKSTTRGVMVARYNIRDSKLLLIFIIELYNNNWTQVGGSNPPGWSKLEFGYSSLHTVLECVFKKPAVRPL